MARSISPASRTLTGITSTLTDGATARIAPNWPIPAGDRGIAKDRHSRQVWRDLFEQFQPFPAHAVFKKHEASGIAARPRQAYRRSRRPPDRRRAGTRSARCGSPAATAEWSESPVARMTSGRKRGQFLRVHLLDVGSIGRGPAMSMRSCGRWSSPKRSPDKTLRCGPEIPDRPRLRAREYADAPHLLALLRARGERPRAAAPPEA